jgi:hypothetical protein
VIWDQSERTFPALGAGPDILAEMSKRGNVSSRSPDRPSTTSVELTERIQTILASKGLTLYQVSQRTAALYGRSSHSFIPHNLYYDLRHEPFTPSIFQVLALSRISGYRIPDWLQVFGIDIENIPRLQVLLPRKRTAMIDSSLTDTQDWVEWFRSKPGNRPVPEVAPLAHLLERVGLQRIAWLLGPGGRKFLYAKIGTQDALAFPDLLPGSIVRINPQLISKSLPAKDAAISDRIFLVQHNKGLFCSRLRRVGENGIVPVGTKLSYAQVELRFPSEAKILGVVDFEIRALLKGASPEVPNELAKLWKPAPLLKNRTFPHLLSKARQNAGLSFREAAAISRSISDELADRRYEISPSSLCDYEVQGSPPRGLHRLVTLCSLYGLKLDTALRSIELPVEHAGTEAMPDRFVGRPSPVESDVGAPAHNGFLEHVLETCEEIPLFLRTSIASVAGLREISIEDCFWIGGDKKPLYPYFARGLLALVNRRRKTPLHFPSKPVWRQPVYLLVQRDGEYLCACCDVENSTLVIHPYTEHVQRRLQFRHGSDIEVAGQIVAIARQMI